MTPVAQSRRRFDGCVVLVTAAPQALVPQPSQFAAEGAHVLITGRNDAEVQVRRHTTMFNFTMLTSPTAQRSTPS